jgi:hypothetical protein
MLFLDLAVCIIARCGSAPFLERGSSEELKPGD